MKWVYEHYSGPASHPSRYFRRPLNRDVMEVKPDTETRTAKATVTGTSDQDLEYPTTKEVGCGRWVYGWRIREIRE